MATTSRKRVSFNPAVRGLRVLSIYDYTPRQIYATWYSEDDMSYITQRAKQVLQKAACKSPEAGKRYCMRGLEGQTKLGSMTKKRNRLDAREAVFEEQGRQWDHEDEEITDPQDIADAYQRVTSSCQLWAQAVGSRDRKAVESYLFEEDDEEESSEEIAFTSSSNHSKLESPDSRIRRRVGNTFGPFQKLARAA